MLELYHNNMSVCAQKVRILLIEKGLQAKEHHLLLRAGEQFSPAYLKLNPKAVVPTLVHDGKPITESTVILEYIDDVFPTPPARPADPYRRAQMRTLAKTPDDWLHEACAIVTHTIAFRHQYQALAREDLERQLAATPDPTRRDTKLQSILQGYEWPAFWIAVRKHAKLLSEMNNILAEQTWLAGPDWSLADAALTPYVVRLEELKIERMFEHHRHVRRWLDAAKSRPSFRGYSAYAEEKFLTLMGEQGSAAWPRIEKELAKV